jgi:uncharacterized protein
MFDRPVVDSVAFAREAGTREGQVAIQDLARLRDTLSEQTGTLHYRLSGFTSVRGKPALRLSVTGDLVLVCQRCLGPLAFWLDSTREFDLIAPDVALDDLAEESEDIEQMHADPKLDVVALVEDEAILSLPMVSAHEPGVCETASMQGGAATESPFGKLSVLKRQ